METSRAHTDPSHGRAWVSLAGIYSVLCLLDAHMLRPALKIAPATLEIPQLEHSRNLVNGGEVNWWWTGHPFTCTKARASSCMTGQLCVLLSTHAEACSVGGSRWCNRMLHSLLVFIEYEWGNWNKIIKSLLRIPTLEILCCISCWGGTSVQLTINMSFIIARIGLTYGRLFYLTYLCLLFLMCKL